MIAPETTADMASDATADRLADRTPRDRVTAARVANGRRAEVGPIAHRAAAARVAIWIGGFNLLPHRQRDARRARKRCVVEGLAAAALGAVLALGIAGWQAVERMRLDDARAVAERTLAQWRAPLAEHARLLLEADDRRTRAARAASMSLPLTHLRDLLDALSFEPGDGVVLQQMRHREHETALLAKSADHEEPAAWLARLSGVHGVSGAAVDDVHRAVAATRRTPQKPSLPVVANPPQDAVEFAARLNWDDARDRSKDRSKDTTGTTRAAHGTPTRGHP
ncbi:fimbrial assembly protein [Paraburkholderia sp.]|uniref:fimbrial assembly protein n=1 Tax=Paraburkholderia sp. TaxID=1926495 RepID=UPI00238A2EC9|nr:fimbrial assembly protein [Paraburkholderia sp.]MDE1180708.1 fimbrial assembly protein [Paraburkholderia sp.]